MHQCNADAAAPSEACAHVVQEIVRDVIAFADVHEGTTPRGDPLVSSSEASPHLQLPDLSPEGYLIFQHPSLDDQGHHSASSSLRMTQAKFDRRTAAGWMMGRM